MKKFLVYLLFIITAVYSFADERIRIVHYVPNQVVEINTNPGIATTIEFGDETINAVAIGNTSGWQATPFENKLFIKPAEDSSDKTLKSTNLTVVTNKHDYYFLIRLNSNQTPTFILRFDYRPATAQKNSQIASSNQSVVNQRNTTKQQTAANQKAAAKQQALARQQALEQQQALARQQALDKQQAAVRQQALEKQQAAAKKKPITKSNPPSVLGNKTSIDENSSATIPNNPYLANQVIPNTFYKRSTNSKILIEQIYDDGKQTFFRFANGQKIPTIYFVDIQGREVEVPYTETKGNFVTVDGVSKKFTLRLNGDVTCIVNDPTIQIPVKPEVGKKIQKKRKVTKKKQSNKK